MPVAANDAIATLAWLRDIDPLNDDGTYSDADVLDTRDAVIDALEDVCKTAFVRRTRTEQFADSVTMRMVALERGGGLNRHAAPVVTALTIHGVAVDLIAEPPTVGRGGLLFLGRRTFGRGCSVTYTHGYEACPGRVRRGVRMLVVDWLTQDKGSAVPDRATSVSNGDTTYALVTAGVRGALFDLPEANAIVAQYRE